MARNNSENPERDSRDSGLSTSDNVFSISRIEEMAGIALATARDPNSTPTQKMQAVKSYETLFSKHQSRETDTDTSEEFLAFLKSRRKAGVAV